MKTLERLLQLKQHQIDQIRLTLQQAHQQLEELDAFICALDDDWAYEESLASVSIEASMMFLAYAPQLQSQKKDLEAKRPGREAVLEAEKGKLIEKYSEMKSLEIALEQQKKRDLQKQKKQQQKALDEWTSCQGARLERRDKSQ